MVYWMFLRFKHVNRLKMLMVLLQKENVCGTLNIQRWSLRLVGFLEKLQERKPSRSFPEWLQNTVDTVGQKGKNNKPLQIIIQLGMRTIQHHVWKMSRDGMWYSRNLQRTELKEDKTETLKHLWPRVEEDFLNDGYAVIDCHDFTEWTNTFLWQNLMEKDNL